MDLLYLVVRNCLHARNNLEIWSATILLAYMMRFVYHSRHDQLTFGEKKGLIVYLF